MSDEGQRIKSPLVRKAEEFFDLPLSYVPGKGWVDRNGKPVKTRPWAEIIRRSK